MFSDKEIMQIHTVLQPAIPDYYIWSDKRVRKEFKFLL